MKRNLIYLAFITIIFLSNLNINNLQAQNFTQQGTEYWVCFENNYKEYQPVNSTDSLYLTLIIASDQDANVTVEVKSYNFKEDRLVKANTSEEIQVIRFCQITSSEVPQNLGVHITSDVPVSVVGLNHRHLSTDSYTALPLEALGTDYTTVNQKKCDGMMSEFAVVATEDNTEVMIVPKVVTKTELPANAPINVKLNKGEVYQIISFDSPYVKGEGDLTGSTIKANKKIAVFSGHQCAYVPNNVHACNHLVEQLLPNDDYGTQYYIGKLESRKKSSVRFVALQDGTEIKINSKVKASNLKAGQFYENHTLDENWFIESNKPIMATQLGQGFESDSIGDPMMILMRSEKVFQTKYFFSTPLSEDWNHYINLVVHKEATATVKLDGEAVDESIFTPCGTSDYMIGTLPLKTGYHSIECEKPFGISSYGFGINGNKWDAYGNM